MNERQSRKDAHANAGCAHGDPISIDKELPYRHLAHGDTSRIGRRAGETTSAPLNALASAPARDRRNFVIGLLFRRTPSLGAPQRSSMIRRKHTNEPRKART